MNKKPIIIATIIMVLIYLVIYTGVSWGNETWDTLDYYMVDPVVSKTFSLENIDWSSESDYVMIPAMEYKFLIRVMDAYQQEMEKNYELLKVNKSLIDMNKDLLMLR